jgi:hypothetical protein
MNRKQLTLLIVLGVVMGGLGFWAYQKKQAPYQESTHRMGEKILPNFPLNDVAHIAIKQRDASVNLVKKDDLWTVRERGDYPANFSNISDALRKIWELKISKPVNVGQSRLMQLELLAPDKAPSTLVELQDKSGKMLTSLLLGAKHMKESAGNSPYGGGSWPDGRYIMVGNDIKTVALVSDALSTLEAKPEDWLNKDWFKVEKLGSISVTTTNATNHWKLSRESETNEWRLADVKVGEQLDTGKSSGVTSALSSPSFNDVATNAAPEKTGLDKPLAAKLETLDGFTYDIKVGNKVAPDKEDYYLQVAVAANLPKERSAGKDEKPEDKTKLDKEFQDKVDKLKEKLKTEKAFEKWTYIVSKWTIDPLLKERKDLLAEKKEETKKEEPNTTSSKPINIPPAVKLPGTGILDAPPPPPSKGTDNPPKPSEKPDSQP